MPGTIQVSVLDLTGFPTSSISIKVSMGTREYQTWDRGDFSFPFVNLRDKLIVTLYDVEGNELSRTDVETLLVVQKGYLDDLFTLEGGGQLHMKLRFILSEEERKRVRNLRESALQKKNARRSAVGTLASVCHNIAPSSLSFNREVTDIQEAIQKEALSATKRPLGSNSTSIPASHNKDQESVLTNGDGNHFDKTTQDEGKGTSSATPQLQENKVIHLTEGNYPTLEKTSSITPSVEKIDSMLPGLLEKSDYVAPPIPKKIDVMKLPILEKINSMTTSILRRVDSMTPPVLEKIDATAPPVQEKFVSMEAPNLEKIDSMTPPLLEKFDSMTPRTREKIDSMAPTIKEKIETMEPPVPEKIVVMAPGVMEKIETMEPPVTEKIVVMESGVLVKIDSREPPTMENIDSMAPRVLDESDATTPSVLQKIDSMTLPVLEQIDSMEATLMEKIDSTAAQVAEKIDSVTSSVQEKFYSVAPPVTEKIKSMAPRIPENIDSIEPTVMRIDFIEAQILTKIDSMEQPGDVRTSSITSLEASERPQFLVSEQNPSVSGTLEEDRPSISEKHSGLKKNLSSVRKMISAFETNLSEGVGPRTSAPRMKPKLNKTKTEVPLKYSSENDADTESTKAVQRIIERESNPLLERMPQELNLQNISNYMRIRRNRVGPEAEIATRASDIMQVSHSSPYLTVLDVRYPAFEEICSKDQVNKIHQRSSYIIEQGKFPEEVIGTSPERPTISRTMLEESGGMDQSCSLHNDQKGSELTVSEESTRGPSTEESHRKDICETSSEQKKEEVHTTVEEYPCENSGSWIFPDEPRHLCITTGSKQVLDRLGSKQVLDRLGSKQVLDRLGSCSNLTETNYSESKRSNRIFSRPEVKEVHTPNEKIRNDHEFKQNMGGDIPKEVNEGENTCHSSRKPKLESSMSDKTHGGLAGQVVRVAIMVAFGTLVLVTRQRKKR